MLIRTNLKTILTISVLQLCICSAGLADKVIYVDDDANGLNNGTSWQNAYKFLQGALADANSAVKPVEIRVAAGIYKPDRSSAEPNGTGDRQATFRLVNGVTIKGGYAGFGEADPNARDITKHETILSGDLSGNDIDVNDPCDLVWEPTRDENSFHVVTGSSTDATAVLDGFTVIAGNAYDTPWQPMVRNPKNRGGGMYNESGSPTLINCTFRNNSAEEWGGGIFNGWGKDCKPTFTGCTFTGNGAKSKGGWEGFGGGMYNAGSRPVLTTCALTNNYARISGAGIYNLNSDLVIQESSINCNVADGAGGGMFNFQGSNAVVTGCKFTGNRAGGDGGGMGNSHSEPMLTECQFTWNSANEFGGAILNGSYSKSTIKNCTFRGNSAKKGGAIYNNIRVSLTLVNSLVTGNSAALGGGIYCGHNCEMAMRNCTFGGNAVGASHAVTFDSYERIWPGKYDISNCIFWDEMDEIQNNDGSIVMVEYSNVQGGETEVNDPYEGVIWGEGNIDVDPRFTEQGYWDPNGTPWDPNDDFWVDGDYHLKSQAGRWDPKIRNWVKDDVTSPCIDAGDPASPIGYEPFPNGGIINMGAYGGTAEASKSYFVEPVCETIVAGDINGDCRVDFKDFAFMAFHWLEDNSP
jgi:predicted outer membrane repeat protein